MLVLLVPNEIELKETEYPVAGVKIISKYALPLETVLNAPIFAAFPMLYEPLAPI